jgi:dephospho-CoA kinase
MLHVGLTGCIASGKSFVAHRLRDLGACLIDADRIVHALLEPGQPAWHAIHARFGESILLPDTCINKRTLGDIAFSDERDREWLNQELHPRVFDAYQSLVRGMHNRPADTIIVFDAALLIETGYHRNMEKLVVVYADPDQQLERLMTRDCMTKEQALARIRAQLPIQEKRKFADYVIDNTRTREETEKQAHKLYAILKKEAVQNR